MRGIHNQRCIACQGKLTPRHIGIIRASIHWDTVNIIELKCVCGGLLYIKESVIELLHPCSTCEGHVDEFGCSNCLAIFKTMAWECHYDG